MEYYLHIGLHKTGTKFFQYNVFPNLRKDQIIYNPPKLTQLIVDLVKAKKNDVDLVLKEINKEKANIEKNNLAKKVLISREVMSGDLFTFYKDYKSHYIRLYKGLSEAKIIMSLRYQTDWIISCYRETLHEHHYQTIKQYLGLEQGEKKFVKANYKNLDYAGILRQIKSLYGSKNISIFFYEDFNKDKMKFLKKKLKTLGLNSVPIVKDINTIPNKGYSALAIYLSIKRYQFFKALKIDRYLIHRPIFFFGDNSIPSGFKELSVLNKDEYWHDKFLRDNEEIRSKGYPHKLSLYEKINLQLSWRNLMKKVLDTIIYKDWDILQKERKLLDSHFKKINAKMLKDHKDLFLNLPDCYL